MECEEDEGGAGGDGRQVRGLERWRTTVGGTCRKGSAGRSSSPATTGSRGVGWAVWPTRPGIDGTASPEQTPSVRRLSPPRGRNVAVYCRPPSTARVPGRQGPRLAENPGVCPLTWQHFCCLRMVPGCVPERTGCSPVLSTREHRWRGQRSVRTTKGLGPGRFRVASGTASDASS